MDPINKKFVGHFENKMNETETNKEVKKEVTDDTKNEGVQSGTISELDRADQIAERQKRENDRRDELLTREENLHARKMVGGMSEAGQGTETPQYSDEEKASRKRIKAVADVSGSSWGKKYE